MATEIKDTVENLHKAFEDFKAEHKLALAEIAKKGHADPLLTEKVDKMNEAISVAEDKAEAAVKAAEKAEQIARRQQLHEPIGRMSEEEQAVKNAFKDYLRKANQADSKSLQILEDYNLRLKSLNSGADNTGGYFVVPQLDQAITRLIYETSPIRQYARNVQISTDQYQKLQSTNLAAAAWADRDAASTESAAPTYNQLIIRANKLTAEPRISQDMIDDSYIDIEKELQDSLAMQYSLTENTAFVNGTGQGQPRGFLTYAAGTSWGQIEQIVSGNATAVTYTGLINLVYGLKDGYNQNAAFMMRRSTVAAIRLLVDGQSRPLWMPGFGSEPATLLGYPVVRAADMPAVASSALAIAFGDFKQGYTIVDRIGTRILRDPYSAKPFVTFYTTRRVGGGVDNFEAIKLMKIST